MKTRKTTEKSQLNKKITTWAKIISYQIYYSLPADSRVYSSWFSIFVRSSGPGADVQENEQCWIGSDKRVASENHQRQKITITLVSLS